MARYRLMSFAFVRYRKTCDDVDRQFGDESGREQSSQRSCSSRAGQLKTYRCCVASGDSWQSRSFDAFLVLSCTSADHTCKIPTS